MKAGIQALCGILWDKMKQEDDMRKQINTVLFAYVEENRKFANGETVIVCDKDTDKEIGKGIVADACTYVRLEPLWLKDYSVTDKFNRDIERIRCKLPLT